MLHVHPATLWVGSASDLGDEIMDLALLITPRQLTKQATTSTVGRESYIC